MNAESIALPLALFSRLGPWEIALILLAVLLLFGGRKLPDLARNLARGFKSFKKELSDVKDQLDDGPEESKGSSDEGGKEA
jgi:sec-independent protein translocase protein TatA